jgi:hypothetical protein
MQDFIIGVEPMPIIVNYWQAMERAAHWRRRSYKEKVNVFIEVAHNWIELARWMRQHNIEVTTL